MGQIAAVFVDSTFGGTRILRGMGSRNVLNGDSKVVVQVNGRKIREIPPVMRSRNTRNMKVDISIVLLGFGRTTLYFLVWN